MKGVFRLLPLWIAAVLVMALSACGGGSGDSSTNQVSSDAVPDFNANPSNNQFLITTDEKKLVVVNAADGSARTVFEFEDNIDFDGVPDYLDGMAYLASDDNGLNAVNLDSGSLEWDAPIFHYDFSSLNKTSTSCTDDLCYVVGHNGVLLAAERSSGKMAWQYALRDDGVFNLNFPNDFGPVIQGDRVYQLSGERSIPPAQPAYLHVIDRLTGNGIRKLELPHDVTGNVTFTEKSMLVPAGNLLAIDPDSFEVLWTANYEAVSTAAVNGDRAVVHAVMASEPARARLIALDLASGIELWSRGAGSNSLYSPVIEQGVVFATGEKASGAAALGRQGRPFSVRLSDGSVLWSRDTLFVRNDPVYANGGLYYFGHDTELDQSDIEPNTGLVAIDATSGTTLWVAAGLRPARSVDPVVVATNGVFGPGYLGK